MVDPVRRPWWQATNSPRLGFVAGAGWLAIGLVQLVMLVSDDDLAWRTARLVLAVLALLLGLFYLASAFALRRRERDRSP